MTPKIAYFVCCTARTGSNLLCELLENTGVAGRPQEHFYASDTHAYAQWETGYGSFMRQVIRATTTPNGVFSTKLMGSSLPFVRAQLQNDAEFQGMALSEILAALFPNLQHIWLTRRDKLKQAISFWRAIQTREFVAVDAGVQMAESEPVYNFDAINRAIQIISLEESRWQEYFNAMRIVPLTLVYEDFVQDMRATVANVLNHLGINDKYSFAKPTLRKQSDDLSQAWLERYHEDEARRSARVEE